MLSPTTAMFTRLSSIFAWATFCKDISKANSLSITRLASLSSSFRTAMHIECSEEACVIIITLMLAIDNTSNKRFEKPGIPTIPLPSRLIKLICGMWLMPFTTVLFISFSV